MLVKVLVVFEVQGGERDAMGEATGRNPHVVDRPRAPAPDGYRGQPSPGGGYYLVAGQHRTAGQPAGELLAAALASVADLRPLGQLSEGHEGDQRLAADQAGGKRPGERAPVQQEWTGTSGNPSAVSAISALICGIGAASAHGARGRTSLEDVAKMVAETRARSGANTLRHYADPVPELDRRRRLPCALTAGSAAQNG